MELVMSNTDPYFAIITSGECGMAQVEFPAESDVFFRFDCDVEQSAAYSMGMVQKIKSALAISDNVQVRMNEQGLLSLQCSIKATGDSQSSFVDFLISPTFVDDE